MCSLRKHSGHGRGVVQKLAGGEGDDLRARRCSLFFNYPKKGNPQKDTHTHTHCLPPFVLPKVLNSRPQPSFSMSLGIADLDLSRAGRVSMLGCRFRYLSRYHGSKQVPKSGVNERFNLTPRRQTSTSTMMKHLLEDMKSFPPCRFLNGTSLCRRATLRFPGMQPPASPPRPKRALT